MLALLGGATIVVVSRLRVKSNHPYEHKIAAFLYYMNISITMPLTEKSKQNEWKTIIAIAKNNDFPVNILTDLKTKITNKENTTATRNNNTEKQMGNLHIP